jgi:serine/threonine-protein kinase
VGSSATVISGRFAPRASIFTSEATWRLIVHSNLPRDRYVNTDRHARGIELPTGHRVLPVPSPFCHFRGAVMLYDPETRVLFSGDLFGGINTPGPHDLWAEESDWTGIRAFHQAYMPTNQVFGRTLQAIRRLDPKVEIIAPQHGRLLRGEMIDLFMDRLAQLPVGLDLMDDAGEGADVMEAWSTVLNRVLQTARLVLGEEADGLVKQHDELREHVSVDGDRLAVTSNGRWTISAAVDLLTRGRTPTSANAIKLEALFACEELELPSPDMHIEEEGAPGSGKA